MSQLYHNIVAVAHSHFLLDCPDAIQKPVFHFAVIDFRVPHFQALSQGLSPPACRERCYFVIHDAPAVCFLFQHFYLFVELGDFLFFFLYASLQFLHFGLEHGSANFLHLHAPPLFLFVILLHLVLLLVVLDLVLEQLVFLSFLVEFVVELECLLPEDDHLLFEVLYAFVGGEHFFLLFGLVFDFCEFLFDFGYVVPVGVEKL